MEAYIANCRMILITNSTTKIIDAIRSRCLQIRVPAPSIPEISAILTKIAKSEGTALESILAEQIAVKSKRNLRQAILSLEMTKIRDPSLKSSTTIEVPDWEQVIQTIASDVLEEQSPQRLLKVREKFYELLGHCVPPEIILRTLTTELLMKLDAELKPEVVSAAALFEYRIVTGTKPIFHLEAFVAQVMCIYKRFLINMFSFE
jgi:replication factor C subunit 3/5